METRGVLVNVHIFNICYFDHLLDINIVRVTRTAGQRFDNNVPQLHHHPVRDHRSG